MNGYLPLALHKSCDKLKDAVDFYCFISTVSVYNEDAVTPESIAATGGIDEDGPLLAFGGSADPHTLGTRDSEDEELLGPNSYGALKVICEEVAANAFGDSLLVIRPGIVAGAWDPTGRLTYWPQRVANGGEVLAPPAEARLQFIDAIDMGEWIVRLCEARTAGIFNAVGTQQGAAEGEHDRLQTTLLTGLAAMCVVRAMALCAGLDGRPTFGEVLEECVKLADEQQMRDALKGTGDMTKAEPTAVHATAEYLVEAGCRTFPLFRLPQSWLAGLAP